MPLDISGVPDEVVARYGLDRLPLDRETISTTDLHRLDGKRVIVTGGGGHGLGAAACARLAEQGADVAVFDISTDAAALTVDAISNRFDVRIIAVEVDIGDAESVQSGVDSVIDDWGGVDILVNNAGGSGSIGSDGEKVTQHGPFAEMRMEDLHTVVRVNLVGPLLMSRAVLPHMLAAGSGRIVNVASEAGKIAVDDLAVYNACKAGVISFTRSLASEVGAAGVTVAGVCPGIMVSDRTIQTLARPSRRGFASLDAGFSRVTIGRCSLADEVASVIAFLASEAGGYIHGTSISVGGGMAD
jgi:NAD(P)-dependent dehydrogenase (short-subunit alcohol dehydrogenase family)